MRFSSVLTAVVGFAVAGGSAYVARDLLEARLVTSQTSTDSAIVKVVLSRFSSGLFRAMFAMKEIRNGKAIHRRVSP